MRFLNGTFPPIAPAPINLGFPCEKAFMKNAAQSGERRPAGPHRLRRSSGRLCRKDTARGDAWGNMICTASLLQVRHGQEVSNHFPAPSTTKATHRSGRQNPGPALGERWDGSASRQSTQFVPRGTCICDLSREGIVSHALGGAKRVAPHPGCPRFDEAFACGPHGAVPKDFSGPHLDRVAAAQVGRGWNLIRRLSGRVRAMPPLWA